MHAHGYVKSCHLSEAFSEMVDVIACCSVASSGMYSGTSLESTFFVFSSFSVRLCVYSLNHMSELAQVWRQDADTIHYQSYQKNYVCSTIVGCNGRVALWVKLPNVFRTDLARFLWSRSILHIPLDWI